MSESQSRGEAKGSIEILQNNLNFFPKEQSLKDLLSSHAEKRLLVKFMLTSPSGSKSVVKYTVTP